MALITLEGSRNKYQLHYNGGSVILVSFITVCYNPSREKTFGMTILEAHLCGTRSVVYKGTACEEARIYMGALLWTGCGLHVPCRL